MKAFVLEKHGKASVLKISHLQDPIPKGNEVCVKICSIGLNYAEVLSRKGLYGWAPKLPYIPGMEAYGEIEALGANVTKHAIGEKVIVGAQHGCYSEKVIAHEDHIMPAIENFSPEENAAFAVNYMTAWVALFKMARLEKDDSVLIHAAAGGVGTAAVQLAKKHGCKVYGTASSKEKLELLHKLEIDQAFDYNNFEREINKLTKGKGVHVIIEMVGGEIYKKSLHLLQPFGRIVVVGFASLNLQRSNPISWVKTWKDIPRVKISQMAKESYGVMASHLGYLLPNAALMSQLWNELVSFTTKHQIRPIVGHVFHFEEMAKAHELMQSRKSSGKIVINVKH